MGLGLPGGGGGKSGSFMDFVNTVVVPPKSDAPANHPDLLDPAVLAARQRAARRMADGLMEAYATSSRGTEGVSGAGLGGPPPDDGPIITSMTGRDFSPADNAAKSAAPTGPQKPAPPVAGDVIPEPGNPYNPGQPRRPRNPNIPRTVER